MRAQFMSVIATFLTVGVANAQAPLFCQNLASSAVVLMRTSEQLILMPAAFQGTVPSFMEQNKTQPDLYHKELGGDCSNQITGLSLFTARPVGNQALLANDWCDDDGWSGRYEIALQCYEVSEDPYVREDHQKLRSFATLWENPIYPETKAVVELLKTKGFPLQQVYQISLRTERVRKTFKVRTLDPKQTCEGSLRDATFSCE